MEQPIIGKIEQMSEFEKRINGKFRTLGAMIGAVCCFLVDEDLATSAELEALTTSILNSTGEDEFDPQKFFEDLRDGEVDD